MKTHCTTNCRARKNEIKKSIDIFFLGGGVVHPKLTPLGKSVLSCPGRFPKNIVILIQKLHITHIQYLASMPVDSKVRIDHTKDL